MSYFTCEVHKLQFSTIQALKEHVTKFHWDEKRSTVKGSSDTKKTQEIKDVKNKPAQKISAAEVDPPTSCINATATEPRILPSISGPRDVNGIILNINGCAGQNVEVTNVRVPQPPPPPLVMNSGELEEQSQWDVWLREAVRKIRSEKQRSDLYRIYSFVHRLAQKKELAEVRWKTVSPISTLYRTHHEPIQLGVVERHLDRIVREGVLLKAIYRGQTSYMTPADKRERTLDLEAGSDEEVYKCFLKVLRELSEQDPTATSPPLPKSSSSSSSLLVGRTSPPPPPTGFTLDQILDYLYLSHVITLPVGQTRSTTPTFLLHKLTPILEKEVVQGRIGGVELIEGIFYKIREMEGHPVKVPVLATEPRTISQNAIIPNINRSSSVEQNMEVTIVTVLPLLMNSDDLSEKKTNICSQCGRGFKKWSDLERHCRIHTGEKPFQCNVCGKSFRVKSTLEAHIRTHEGERPFICNVCNKSFTTKSSLLVHFRTHTGSKPYKCEHCDRCFRTSAHRRSHIRSHFKPSKGIEIQQINLPIEEHNIQCHICGEFCSSSKHLDEHLQTHFGDNLLPTSSKTGEIEIKAEVDSKVSDIEYHTVKAEIDSDVDSTMDVDGAPYDDTLYEPNETEESSESSDDNGNSDPDFCPPDIEDDFDTPRHEKEPSADVGERSKKLLKARPHFCHHPGCTRSKGFTDLGRLKEHLDRHTGGNKCFECSWKGCNYKSARCNDLELHYRTHTGEKPTNNVTTSCKCCARNEKHKKDYIPYLPTGKLICYFCGYAPASRHFDAHMSKHTLERPYRCKICNKLCHDDEGVKEHAKVHTDDDMSERHFKCTDCGSRFKDGTALRKHRSTHSTYRPFSCSQCLSSHKRFTDLKRHVQTVHGSVKAYKCDICKGTKEFARRDFFKLHMSTAHPGVMYNEPESQFKETNHTSDYYVITCNLCKIHFKDNLKFLQHQKKCSGTVKPGKTKIRRIQKNEPLKLKCKVCDGRLFNSEDGLKSHMKLFHDLEETEES